MPMRVLLCLGLICLAFVGTSGGAEMPPSITVHATVETGQSDDLNLKLSITNVSNRSITLFKSDLPWATRHALLVVPVTADQKASRLEEALYVDDPGPGSTTLAPSQELSGRVQLKRRFPGLSAALEHTDVILFWSYQTELSNKEKTNRVSGAVLIPQVQQPR
jgi:hypothetical protein